ncbi:MAG: hypothetical protein EOO77_02620 [Oxalobacteraceae bacterium]|nr:MAG: hypothetical protein EOO77_02620 [Oxalobacteraceae bacterium]
MHLPLWGYFLTGGVAALTVVSWLRSLSKPGAAADQGMGGNMPLKDASQIAQMSISMSLGAGIVTREDEVMSAAKFWEALAAWVPGRQTVHIGAFTLSHGVLYARQLARNVGGGSEPSYMDTQ